MEELMKVFNNSASILVYISESYSDISMQKHTSSANPDNQRTGKRVYEPSYEIN